MRDYTFKEKTRITAGAVAALVIVLWLAVVALGILSVRIGEHMATARELCSTPENNGFKTRLVS